MSDTEPLTVDCGPHGKRVATVVCCHLRERSGEPAGFVENSDDPNDLQAWCFACEEKYQQEDGMTDAFREFNNFSIVCCDCYAASKAFHLPISN